MEKYITDQYGDIKFKRGRWYILETGVDDWMNELWHRCEKDDWELESCRYFAWSNYADRRIMPKWRCEVCSASPPDSIVTVWCLLEPDMTSEEVIEALKSAEEAEKAFAEELETYSGWGDMHLESLEADWYKPFPW